MARATAGGPERAEAPHQDQARKNKPAFFHIIAGHIVVIFVLLVIISVVYDLGTWRHRYNKVRRGEKHQQSGDQTGYERAFFPTADILTCYSKKNTGVTNNINNASVLFKCLSKP